MPAHRQNRTRSSLLSALGTTALVLLAFACSDGTSSAPGAAAAQNPSSPGDGGGEGGGGGGGDADAATKAPPITIANITSFDATKFELPEALSYRDGFAYVSIAPKGEIAKIEVATGKRTTYASLPVAASSFVLGSAFDAAGNLFVGVGATNWDDAAGLAAAGIYKIPPGANGAGGTPTLFASAESSLKFGNGLAFDDDGVLFVSDAADGAIYRIPAAGAVGTATAWKKDAALSGDMNACPGTVAGFPIGANGIVVDASAVFIGNTDRGTLLRIPREAGDVAGEIATVASDCTTLEGLDGLRPDPRDPTNAFLGTNNPKNELVRITRSGVVTIVHEAAPPSFDGPADLVHVTGTSAPFELLVVNSAFPEAFAPPDAGLVPQPSLVKVTLP